MEHLDIQQVLENFTAITGIKARWRPLARGQFRYDYVDGIVQFKTNDATVEIAADFKKNLQNPNIPTLINQKNHNKEMLILANTIMPRFKEQLQELGINYIDAVGNAYIKHGPLMIWIDGKKEIPAGELKTKPFSKAGLKVIFQFLLDGDSINDTFREIAKAADVSLDTVHKTVAGLKQLQYVVPLNNHTLQWNNKKELLNRWITEYETRLKPGIHIGNFTFVNEKDFLNWKKINFKSTLTRWGGEPGAELLTGNLKPENLTIYTNESRIDWIKNYKMIPSPKGYISIYQRFWQIDEIRKNTVPPVLVYADLINTGNRRNIETAQKIYEQYLQDKF